MPEHGLWVDADEERKAAAMQRPIPQFSARAIGGRETVDSTQTALFSVATYTASDINAVGGSFSLENISFADLGKLSPYRLLELLINVSPDISRAHWDYLRMCNPGWEITCFRSPGSGIRYQRAEQAIQDFITTLNSYYVDFNVVINRLLSAVWLRGALAAELVIAADGMTPIDLATPDPASIQWEKQRDPVRGEVWVPYQDQVGDRVYLTDPTFKYVPIDPVIGSPRGRPLASPALFSTLFLLAMLYDIRRVVQQQGYVRLDIEIDLEALTTSMPDDLDGDPTAVKAWVDKAITDIKNVYAALKPDDAFVHTSSVKLNRPVGTVDASSLDGVVNLIGVLEKMVVRGLKTMPLVLGIVDQVSEANANRQWEIYAAGIKAIQHFSETLLQSMFQLALQAQGIPAVVKMAFAELRTAELLRDAQVALLMGKVAAWQYQQGWISQDAAANVGTLGAVSQADQTEPRAPTMPQPTNVGTIEGSQPDPGSTRAMLEQMLQERRHDEGLNRITDGDIYDSSGGANPRRNGYAAEAGRS